MKELVIFKKREPRPVKLPKTSNPWLLETVENGLRATSVKELLDDIRADRAIPVQYFEYDRLFGDGAFREKGALRVMRMFDELKEITPKTVGFIFGLHKYLYSGNGILRKNYETGRESFYSEETLRNQNIACYFNLELAKEEATILQAIEEATEELDNATSGRSTDNDRKRISDQDT